MTILDHVKSLQKKANDRGDYKTVAAEIGVSYHWLQKFAGGHIQNPTVENVSKLERFFSRDK
jgi:hypothetical protein